jgi:hypothetical protein
LNLNPLKAASPFVRDTKSQAIVFKAIHLAFCLALAAYGGVGTRTAVAASPKASGQEALTLQTLRNASVVRNGSGEASSYTQNIFMHWACLTK